MEAGSPVQVGPLSGQIQPGSRHVLLNAGKDRRPPMAAKKQGGEMIVGCIVQSLTAEKEPS